MAIPFVEEASRAGPAALLLVGLDEGPVGREVVGPFEDFLPLLEVHLAVKLGGEDHALAFAVHELQLPTGLDGPQLPVAMEAEIDAAEVDGRGKVIGSDQADEIGRNLGVGLPFEWDGGGQTEFGHTVVTPDAVVHDGIVAVMSDEGMGVLHGEATVTGGPEMGHCPSGMGHVREEGLPCRAALAEEGRE